MSIDQGHTLLSDAIARNVPAILSAPAVGPGEAWRSRLLAHQAGAPAQAGEPGQTVPAGVWVDAVPGQSLLTDALQRSGRTVGVSFRSGEHLVRFAAPILRHDRAYPLSPTATADALLLAWPADVEVVQRRAGYRAKRPLDAAVKLRVWTMAADPLAGPAGGAQAARPPAELAADLRDLSVGGLGVVLRAAKGEKLAVAAGDPLRVELSAAGKTVTAGVVVRHAPQPLPDGSVRAGLDFVGLTDTLEGRRALALIAGVVAEFQRTEARRRRAG
jgi:c-di-GMP-binding flagellar brake protein YcgR